MRLFELTSAILWHSVSTLAFPGNVPASTTSLAEPSSQPLRPDSAPAHSIRRRSVEGDDAKPGDLIFQDTTEDYIFEIGPDLVDRLNEIGGESCTDSEEDCQAAVEELIEGLPETGNYFVRNNDDGSNEPRQLSALIGAEAAIVGYMLHKIFNEPEPELIHVTLDPEAEEKRPIEITLPKSSFPESITETETTTVQDQPFEKYVLIATAIAGSEKLVSAVSSAVAAIATDGPVIPAISDYNVGLPGFFLVNATFEQQLELALIPGVEYIVDGLPEPLEPELGDADDEDLSETAPARRSEAPLEGHGFALEKRDASKRNLPWPDLGERDYQECLRFASWGDGMQLPPEYYLYQDRQGEDYPIYAFEKGFDLTHEEFADARDHYPDHDPLEDGQAVPAELTWFNGASREWDSRTSLSGASLGETRHGTGMLSVLMSRTLGIVPKNRPTLVRINWQWLSALGAIASHIEQRQQTHQEARSPILVITLNWYMSGKDEDDEDWPFNRCVWAERVAGHLRKLHELGTTILAAVAQRKADKPFSPTMIYVISQYELGQKCFLQHGIDIPAVEGIHFVTAVDTSLRRSLRNRDMRPNAEIPAELAGPWACSVVDATEEAPEWTYNRKDGTSLTSYWAAGVLADLWYQAEDSGSLPSPDTPMERSKVMIEAAKGLTWTREAPSEDLKLGAFWNGLREPKGRDDESTSTAGLDDEATSTEGLIPTASDFSMTLDLEVPPMPTPTGPILEGWCGVHVKQTVYEKGKCSITTGVYDANRTESRLIGGKRRGAHSGDNLPYGSTYFTTSLLPLTMEVTAHQPADNEFRTDYGVSFKYGSQWWNALDVDANGNQRCSVGEFDHANPGRAQRDMDCGFECPGV